MRLVHRHLKTEFGTISDAAGDTVDTDQSGENEKEDREEEEEEEKKT